MFFRQLFSMFADSFSSVAFNNIVESIMTDIVIFQRACAKLPHFYFMTEI